MEDKLKELLRENGVIPIDLQKGKEEMILKELKGLSYKEAQKILRNCLNEIECKSIIE